jgi:hypothetical protein
MRGRTGDGGAQLAPLGAPVESKLRQHLKRPVVKMQLFWDVFHLAGGETVPDEDVSTRLRLQLVSHSYVRTYVFFGAIRCLL